MKKTRLSIEIVMTAVCVACWVNLLWGVFSDSTRFERIVHTAETRYEQKLYKLSADSYRAALRTRQSEDLYEKLLTVLKDYYAEEDTNSVRKQLIQGYSDATSAYPLVVKWWEEYAGLYVDSGSYANAVNVLKQANENNISSDLLSQQWKAAYYAIRSGGGRFQNISPVSIGGRFVIQRDGLWGAATATGDEVIAPTYPIAGPVGEGGRILFSEGEKECFLFDGSGTMTGRFEGVPEEMYGYGAGVIPMRLAGRDDWSYIGSVGTEAFGGFQRAGRFQNENAAVKKDDQWFLIGTDGNSSVQSTWEEIRLDETGAWLCGPDRMIARRDGVWNIYDINGQLKGELNADDIDAGRGGWIAFQKGGEWGYADTDGNIVIQPTYQKAKSFSGGVGAVFDGALWGFINASGDLIVDYQYIDAGYFNASGYCPVILSGGETWKLIRWAVER